MNPCMLVLSPHGPVTTLGLKLCCCPDKEGHSISGFQGSPVLPVVGNNVLGTPCTWYCWPWSHHQELQMPPGRDIGRKPPVEGHSWNMENPSPSGCKYQPPYALSPSQLVAVFSSASLEKSQPWQCLLTMCLCHLKATEIKKDQNNPYHCQRPPLMLLILCQILHVISGMIHRIASGPQGMHPEMDDCYLNENPEQDTSMQSVTRRLWKHLECPPCSEQHTQPWPPSKPVYFPRICFCCQLN